MKEEKCTKDRETISREIRGSQGSGKEEIRVFREEGMIRRL